MRAVSDDFPVHLLDYRLGDPPPVVPLLALGWVQGFGAVVDIRTFKVVETPLAGQCLRNSDMLNHLNEPEVLEEAAEPQAPGVVLRPWRSASERRIERQLIVYVVVKVGPIS